MNVDDIKVDIQRTRNALDGTLHALTHKLRPQHLLERVLGKISGVTSSSDRAQTDSTSDEPDRQRDQNRPVLGLLVGAGIVYYLYRSNGVPEGRSPHRCCTFGSTGAHSVNQPSNEPVKAAPTHGPRVDSERYSDPVHQSTPPSSRLYCAEERSREHPSGLEPRPTPSLVGIAKRPRAISSLAKSRVDRSIQAHPLALGCTMAALGLSLGLTAPCTQFERRLMGR